MEDLAKEPKTAGLPKYNLQTRCLQVLKEKVTQLTKMLFQSGALPHGGRCRTQYAAFLSSLFVFIFLLPLRFAETAYGDINSNLFEAAAAGNTADVAKRKSMSETDWIQEKQCWRFRRDSE